jgi:hypothetical protein
MRRKAEPKPEQKRDRHGFRGTPPPPSFDFDALSPGTLLTELETAAVGRWSTNTLTAWRLQPSHPLQWTTIAGGLIRYRVAAIRAFLASGTPRKRKPKGTPAATTEIRTQDATSERRRAPRRSRAEAAPQEASS